MSGRTREQALERPEPGDRWKAKSGYERTVKKTSTRSGRTEILYAELGFQVKEYLAPFRRWCATAEFLGGTSAK